MGCLKYMITEISGILGLLVFAFGLGYVVLRLLNQ